MSKIKLLWLPELATIDKRTGKIILDADSNIVIMEGICKTLYECGEFQLYTAIPRSELTNVPHIAAFNTSIFKKIYCYSDVHSHAFSLRYNFDFKYYSYLINAIKPDVIVNNNSAITRNIVTVAYMLGMRDVSIINFMHFLDSPDDKKVPKNVSYFTRQIEGILSADVAVYQSKAVKAKAEKDMKTYFKKAYLTHFDRNIGSGVWNATYSFDNANKFPANRVGKKKILFPNRLSSTNYSNHSKFFNAINRLSNVRDDFYVIINNPTGYLSRKNIEELVVQYSPHHSIYTAGNGTDY